LKKNVEISRKGILRSQEIALQSIKQLPKKSKMAHQKSAAKLSDELGSSPQVTIRMPIEMIQAVNQKTKQLNLANHSQAVREAVSLWLKD